MSHSNGNEVGQTTIAVSTELRKQQLDDGNDEKLN